MTETIPVSIILPVKNEEANIARCLDCLKEFSEVVIVDSQSNDQTRPIAESYDNVSVLDFQWNGKYPKKRNWCLENYSFANQWIMFVDADEFINDKLRREIRQVVADSQSRYNGYWIPFQNYFMGRLLKHGDKTARLTLFKLGTGKYEMIDEKHWSALDMEIHEKLIVQGPTATLKAPVLHEDFKGLKRYIDRHNEYSSWEAGRYIDLMDNHRDAMKNFKLRRKIKYRLIDTWIMGPAYFFVTYILKLGFLDGAEGFMYAALKMHYFFQVHCKIRELRKKTINP